MRTCFLGKALLVFQGVVGVLSLQAARPVTHEDFWQLKRFSAPAVSPNGRWVVVPVLSPTYEEKTTTSDLWLLPVDGSAAPRQLTFTKDSESGVAWSPDGRSLAFSTKREGDDVPQVYVLELAGGGEARRVTSLSGGARAPQWSPDGSRLLFLSSVYPNSKDDEENFKISQEKKNSKVKVRVYDGFPIRYWDKWLDEQQTHVFVQDVSGAMPARDLLAGTQLVAKSGFGGRQGDSGEEMDATWTPDGKGVVFSATTERDRIAYSNSTTHLYLVDAAGGEPKGLTEGAFTYGHPRFTEDGKHLLATRNAEDGELYHLSKVVTWTWPAMGKPTVTAEGSALSVMSFQPSPDNESVYYSAEKEGHVVLCRAKFASEKEDVVPMTSGSYVAFDVGGKAEAPVLVSEFNTASVPSDLYRVAEKTGERTALTRFNADAFKELELRPAEEFWFTAKNGRRIHNLVIFPPGYDAGKKYPLVTLIHGGPHSMSRDAQQLRWPAHLLAAGGRIVLQTNYTGSTGFGERFAQAIKGDVLKGPGDELLEAIDEAARRYPSVDTKRLAAVGASYGGHLVNWLQGNTTRFKALVCHAGLINLESQWATSDVIYHRELSAGGLPWEGGSVWREHNPVTYAANFKTPILLTVGEKDFRVPLNNTLEAWSIYQRLKVPSRLLVFPEENHWIRNAENARFHLGEVDAWLKKWL